LKESIFSKFNFKYNVVRVKELNFKLKDQTNKIGDPAGTK